MTNTSPIKRLAVLVSGTGSLVEPMLKQHVPIVLVLADRPCRALDIANAAGIPTVLVPRSFNATFDREQFTLDVLAHVQNHRTELVAMAGFKTIFSAHMFSPDAYQLKILNTHPSLLPAYKGGNAVRDTLQAGAKVTGCTIHLATENVDDGPILLQEVVPVLPGDTVKSLHARINDIEKDIYPKLLLKLLT